MLIMLWLALLLLTCSVPPEKPSAAVPKLPPCEIVVEPSDPGASGIDVFRSTPDSDVDRALALGALADAPRLHRI